MKRINDDWWPDRDEACHRVCYNLIGAEIASSYCEKHDLVIQAGGNVGVWPRFLRTIFASVWTFEPSKENFDLMAKNLSGMDVKMTNAALGMKSGRCSMIFNPRNCGDDRTVPGDETEVVAIDDLGIDPDLIYLDVQGDELAVLAGAEATLKRCAPIVAIEHDRKFVQNRGDPIGLLIALGYHQLERYGQDRIFSTKSFAHSETRAKYVRTFKTKEAAIEAARNLPPKASLDLKRMTWRHDNGAKTHFKVGD